MKTLNIVESAYRGTLEEQDDTVIWITHAMKGAGAELDVLLRGNAVNYAVSTQDTPRLVFGDREQTHTPRLAEDVSGLVAKGAAVYIVQEDLAERGLADADLIGGLKPVTRGALPQIFESYERVWHW